MKQKKLGLSIELDNRNQREELSNRLSMLLTGLVLMLGIWGLGRELLSNEVLIGAVLALGIILLPDRGGKLALPLVLAAGAGVIIFAVVFLSDITSSLGVLCNDLIRALMEKTGYYIHRFETEGVTAAGSLWIGILLGAIVAVVVRCGNVLPSVVLTAAVLILCIIGIFPVNLWLGLYLAGIVLQQCFCASGNGRSYIWCGGLFAAICAVTLMLGGYQEVTLENRVELKERIHSWRYDCTANPLPEGRLSSLGRWSPGTSTALEITMEQWQGLYLRGFTGSIYTGSGWEEEDTGVLAKNGDFLYTLQNTYFHPYQQFAAAAAVQEEAVSTEIQVRVRNACKAYAYLPYGITAVELDSKDLTDPAMEQYSGRLLGLADAYLIQKTLSDADGQSSYLDAESAYREFVLTRYLELPQEVQELMRTELGNVNPLLTTTEIKELVQDWVNNTLQYDEYASTRAGSKDLANYLVNTSSFGYSVHYATLATLALRYMGLPARYVEGYVVTRAAASSMGGGETMALSQENAHAWTEYYLDGVGWVPFDVTPGFEKELIYHLPPDGTGMQNRPPQEETEPTEPEEPPVKQDPDPSSQNKHHAVKIVYSLLLLALLVMVLGMLLRVFVLRNRLRKRLERFRQEDSKEVMLDCVSYQLEVLSLLGLENRNVPLSHQSGEISQILFGDNVEELVQAAQRLCFSDHPVDENQRTVILAGLDRVLHVWHQVTPKGKKLRTRWLSCQVL